jgi:hypothetical protein
VVHVTINKAPDLTPDQQKRVLALLEVIEAETTDPVFPRPTEWGKLEPETAVVDE